MLPTSVGPQLLFTVSLAKPATTPPPSAATIVGVVVVTVARIPNRSRLMDYNQKAAAPRSQWKVWPRRATAAARLGFCLAACQISMATPPVALALAQALALALAFVSICGKVICAPQRIGNSFNEVKG